MDISNTNFQSKTLQHAKNSEEYRLYKAALEWDLIDPIVIESRDDFKSEHKWKDRVEPYHHQVTNLIKFCRRLPVTLLADDVGLGKTISAGLIISELASRGRLSKILIVCPKILGEQWKEELDTKFNIASKVVTGRKLLQTSPSDDIEAIITTYESAREYLEEMSSSGFDMLVLDEAHKLRNLYGVDPSPQVAQRFRKALENRQFKYVLMLTATPIQNRLWDLYSLVDLLAVARGHENPFGTVGTFERKFIEDDRHKARKLKINMQDEFRSIVYKYMSRVRREDANLYFPSREVQLHRTQPTSGEIELIEVVSEHINEFNTLSQIGILQSLVSSPEALAKRLENMVENGTAQKEFALEVRKIANKIPITAKLNGLGEFINNLKKERLDWRLVVFTEHRETQTSIEVFLQEKNIPCALINGDTGSRNPETLEKFKKDIPEINVIISTRAGSEGINLQAANVLVNYDLPWNPMIVEQRIGRIQRLASNHAKVSIFNIVLEGTFEESIVGRLMEKLQMASHAIGDIESLLEAAGVNENGDNDSADSFSEKILQLVLASLEGKDTGAAIELAEKSILNAKTELEKEKVNIDSLFTGMDEAEFGPRCPKLPGPNRSMSSPEFVLTALAYLGAELTEQSSGLYLSKIDGKNDLIKLDGTSRQTTSTLYTPGSGAFNQLVNKIVKLRLHQVEDTDQNAEEQTSSIIEKWVDSFGGKLEKFNISDVMRSFEGVAFLRVRATTAHDSYEQLVEATCIPQEHSQSVKAIGFEGIPDFIEDPAEVGISTEILKEKAWLDPGVSEFCRFYSERKMQEVESAGGDIQKKKKLEDEFTPRVEVELVSLKGNIGRRIKTNVSYRIEGKELYSNVITLIPSQSEVVDVPVLEKCEKTGRLVPANCLAKCEVSGKLVLKDFLVKSQLSDRVALSEHIVICSLSGKHVLSDEVDKSIVTGQFVAKNLMKVSLMSGKHAEPEFFDKCDFTKTEVLKDELAVSQISGKQYRIDEALKSSVSGKTGHKQEFIFCSITNQPLIPDEAEKCEITGKIVIPGILEDCSVTGKHVLPSELDKSAVSGKKALKKLFVSSSISNALLLEEEGIKSVDGKHCVPLESKVCAWSDRKCHPDDIRFCELTGLPVHFEFIAMQSPTRIEVLVNLLNGISQRNDRFDVWEDIQINVASKLNLKKIKIESTVQSPDKKKLAIVFEIRSWLRFKVQLGGVIYSLKEKNILGKSVIGKRSKFGWTQES